MNELSAKPRSPEIAGLVQALGETSVMLAESIQSLEQRLNPVCRVSTPTTQNCKEDRAIITDMGNALSCIHSTLNACRGMVTDIYDRLEI